MTFRFGVILLVGIALFAAVTTKSLDADQKLALTPEEQVWLDGNPRIRVHNETDWPPFNFAVDGEPRGYSIDFMNMITARIGIEVDYVTGPSWNEFLEMMKEGSLDVMLNIVKTPDRQKYLLYTPPYADNPNTVLSHKENSYESLEELSGKTVSIPKGFFYEEVLTREFPDIKLHLVKNTLDSIKAVSFGHADAAVGELAVLNHLLDEHLISDMFVTGEVKMGDPELSLLNIATRKDLPILASILRKAVASVTDKDHQELREKWVPLHFEAGIDVILVVQIGAVAGFFLLVIVVWNRQLHREVSRRRKAEKELTDTLNILRTILDNVPGGVRCVDKDHRILAMNQEYRDLWNLPESVSKIGSTVFDELNFMVDRGDYGAGDKDKLVSSVMNALKFTTEPQHYERTTTEGKHLECYSRPLGQGGYVSIYIDITERKKAERELAEKEAHLADAVKLAQLGRWTWDEVEDKCTSCSVEYAEIHGYESDKFRDMLDSTDASPKLAHPDDRERLAAVLHEARENATSWDIEYRIIRSDGAVRHVRMLGNPVLDDAGTLVASFGTVQDITERKSSEEALRTAREQLMDAIESISEGFAIYDNDDALVVCNTIYRDLYGYTEDEAKPGVSLDDLFAIDVKRKTFKTYLKPGEEPDHDVDDHVKGLKNLEVEFTDGRWVHMRDQETSAGGTVSVHRDITERKQSEEVLRKAHTRAAEAEALFKDAMNNISDGFVLYDTNDRLVICNDKFRELYQYTNEDTSNRPTWIELEKYDTHRKIIAWESDSDVPRGRRRWDDFQRKLSDGRWVDIRQRRTTMGGLVCIHVDITDQKRAEKIMSEARDAAERVADAKSEFVAVVSHEVRTPMNGVLGMARLLLDGELNDEQRDIAETIVRSGDALLTIVNDLLDVSKLEAGRLELEAIPFSPHDLISQTVSAVTPRTAEKGLKLETELSETIPAVVIGDPNRLRQVLLNLLDNAVKFTDTGMVSLVADAVITGEESADLTFAIRDTGPGMTLETQEKIFAPYSQAAIEVARKYGGTGLGLTICRRLANLMGGTIKLDSVIGEGSTFHVRIPVPVDTRTNVDSLKSYRDRHGPALPKASVQLRILQVEDDATNREVAERSLARAGHQVVNVENGSEALEALQESAFDLVLMDRHMPVMDGVEATQRIRAMAGPIAQIPIVGITAGATEREIDGCMAAGMNTCLTKPVNPRILVETVHRYGNPDSKSISLDGKQRFLFVDDDDTARRVAVRQFSKLGQECDTAASGTEAIQLVQVHDYGAVFTDISMPGMDGVELTERLRKREVDSGGRMPIIAVTGHVSPEDRKRFLTAGMDDVIIKPMTVEVLSAIVGNASVSIPTGGATDSSIDMARLVDILGDDDPDELAGHIAMFLEQFPELLDDLRAAFADDDRQAIRDAAHAAKSAATYAAAVDLAALLQALEKAAPDEETEALKDRFSAISHAFQAVSVAHGSDGENA